MTGGRVLVVTNDFPPRPGGIQAFLHNMALRLDPSEIVVYASTWKRGQEGAEATARFDNHGIVGVPEIDGARGSDSVTLEDFAGEQVGVQSAMHDTRRLGAALGPEHHHQGQLAGGSCPRRDTLNTKYRGGNDGFAAGRRGARF